MIHQVKLSPSIERRLSEVVKVQMALLAYGASTATPSLDDCARYLHDQGFDRVNPTRSHEIATWVWKSEKRRDPLAGFASGPPDEKRTLAERLQRETDMLSAHPPIGTINTVEIPGKPRGQRTKSWQEHGADFLQRFYDELSTSKTGLPACFFSDPEAKNVRRQDVLSAFVAENAALYVCPVCDDSGNYTISNNKIYTVIEHYFPQSLYPHLSCHPYNLIPICHLCNSAIHGDKDPLQPDQNAPRLQLQDIVLPYRDLSLGIATRLSINLDDDAKTFTGLVSIGREDAYATHIKALLHLYNIPERWNKHHAIDKVGETLFRRMRQFLRGAYDLSVGNTPESVWPVFRYALYQLVYSLHTKGAEGYKGGDFGKDPFAFAMKWLLVTLLSEEERLSAQDSQARQQEKPCEFHLPLFRELNQWVGQEMSEHDEYIACAQELINILNNENVMPD